jgi:hypothetical protein
MFPHERSLVSEMKDRPFVLLGVNTDQTVAEVKQWNQLQDITWRSWFDGKSNVIRGQYRVQGFPTLYLLDHDGIIRKMWLGGQNPNELANIIDNLVKEAEQRTAQASLLN